MKSILSKLEGVHPHNATVGLFISLLAIQAHAATDTDKPFEMIVDRPFLFVIHHLNPSGASSILFMGVVFDPPQ